MKRQICEEKVLHGVALRGYIGQFANLDLPASAGS
jgi:hypothetical protein